MYLKRLGTMLHQIHFCSEGDDFQLQPPTAYCDFIKIVLQRPMDALTGYLSFHQDNLKPATLLSRLDDIATFATWFCLHHLVEPSLLLSIKDCLVSLRRTYRRRNKALRSQTTMESEVCHHCIYYSLF
jgi:hypothetical protein